MPIDAIWGGTRSRNVEALVSKGRRVCVSQRNKAESFVTGCISHTHARQRKLP